MGQQNNHDFGKGIWKSLTKCHVIDLLFLYEWLEVPKDIHT
jgi:hypothetical protein